VANVTLAVAAVYRVGLFDKEGRIVHAAVKDGVLPHQRTDQVSGNEASEYLVRQANSGDRDQLIRLISMMDYVTDGSARYDWLYASNPHGPAQSWIAVERRTGRAVACTSFFPRKLLVDGVLRRGALGGDAYVETQARRRGLAKALHRASFASFAEGNVEFMFGPPYEDNLQALVKAGANFVGKLESSIRLLSLPKLHRIPAYYRAASRQLGKTLTKAVADLPNLLRKPELTASGLAIPVTLSPVERFDEEFDRFFEACSVNYRIVGLRDAGYLNWRYLAAPSRRQIPFAARCSGRLIGMVALEIFRDRAEIIDLVTLAEPEFVDGVLDAVIAKAEAHGCCVVSATSVCDSQLSRHLHSRAFRQTESLGFQVAVPAAHPQREVLVEPTAWHFTLADGDMDVAVHGP
jgi:hypothetical protein